MEALKCTIKFCLREYDQEELMVKCEEWQTNTDYPPLGVPFIQGLVTISSD